MDKQTSSLRKRISSLGAGVKSLLFENLTTRQTVAKNTFWLTVSNVGGRLLRSVVIIYAARVLGAAAWGVFSYAITLVGFLTSMIDFGINPILVREMAKTTDTRERPRIISTAFFIKLALIATGASFIFFAGPRLTNIDLVKRIIPVVTLVFIFDAIREFGFALIKALERMEWEAGLYLATNAAIVIFGFFFLYFHATVFAFTFSYAVGTALGMIATLIALRGHVRDALFHFTRRLVRPIIAAAWPFTISGFLGILMINTDILIIGWIGAAVDVGLYSAAQRIVQLIYVLPMIVTFSVLPALSRLAQTDRARFRQILEQILTSALMVAIPMGLGGIILGHDIMRLVFGSDYLAGTASFQILMLTLIVDFTAVIISNAIFTFNRQRTLIIYSAIGGALNVALDIILIPRFGITGSAWATLIAQCVSNFYLWRTLKGINYFTVFPHLKRIAIASIIMALFTMGMQALGAHVVLTIALSIVVYFGILAVLRERTLRELKLILANHEL